MPVFLQLYSVYSDLYFLLIFFTWVLIALRFTDNFNDDYPGNNKNFRGSSYSVPMSYREGSLALGAGLWQTIRKVVLPAAKPGILSGIILSIGRALGETAALIFTMGFDYRLANGIKSSARVLSVHLYQLVREGISFERAFATAFVLMIFIFLINTATVAIVTGKNNNGE